MLELFYYEYLNLRKEKRREANRKRSIIEWAVITVALLCILAALILSLFPGNHILTVVFLGSGMLIVISYAGYCSVKRKQIKVIEAKREDVEHWQNTIRDLLRKYGVNPNKDDEIDKVIDLFRHEKEKADFWGRFLQSVSKLSSLAIIPVVTYVLTKAAEQAEIAEVIRGAVVIIFIVVIISLILLSVSWVYKPIVNKRMEDYEDLIFDLEQVKAFKGINRAYGRKREPQNRKKASGKDGPKSTGDAGGPRNQKKGKLN